MNRFTKTAVFFAGMLLSVFLLANTADAASYTVASNDSLSKIGTLFNSSADTIMKDNSLKSSVIYPGQVLYVRAETHTVKSGDTLYLISKGRGVTLPSLRKANNKWDDKLVPSQKLAIPAAVNTTAASTGTKAVISYTQSDLDLLARLVTSEADSEPYNAKVGVAAVVVSRVLSSTFPNSISSVIYEKSYGYYQFTPVENGYINKPASQDAKNAAYAALHGSDPSNGALYYFDDSATNKWLWSKPITARIGRMVFVY